jgi:hypothetical protein
MRRLAGTRAWLRIPDDIEKALAGLDAQGLDLRGGPEGWSIRETAHHLVEANLVASTIVIAGLARSGSRYDWSWVTPDAAWMRRVGYTKAPLRPALAALRALGAHVAGLIGLTPGGLRRSVRLLDEQGGKPYSKTLARVLTGEVEHAAGHLGEVAEIREVNRDEATRGTGRRRRRGHARRRARHRMRAG